MRRSAGWIGTASALALLTSASWAFASPPPAGTSPPVPADAEMAPAPPPIGPASDFDRRLDAAVAHLQRRDYDLAVAGLTALIEDSQIDEADRLSAYDRRSAAYVARKQPGDALLALADAKASGAAGLYVQVHAPQVGLKVGRRTTATLARGRVALVSKVNGDWLWVASVDGDKKTTGYLTLASVAPVPLHYSREVEPPEMPGAPVGAPPSYGLPRPAGPPPRSSIGGKPAGTGSSAQEAQGGPGRPAGGQSGKGAGAHRDETEQPVNPKSDGQSTPAVKTPPAPQP